MLSQDISRQLRAILEELPDAPPLIELLLLVDDFVLEVTSSTDPKTSITQLEDELQNIHHSSVDHSVLQHTGVFLAVLHHLGPVLTPTSIISRWFELVLRPALREPKLPVASVDHAKGLIVTALQTPDEENLEKVAGFRRRLLELYLLDAYNEISGDEVLEWAELDSTTREKKSRWKINLTDILLKFGIQSPHCFLSEVEHQFVAPSSRLQLLILLNQYTSNISFPSSASVFAEHPLVSSLIHSLLLDNSSIACTVGLTLMTKLLTIFAVEAYEDLKHMLPAALAVLARMMCWKERQPPPQDDPTEEKGPPDLKDESTLNRDFAIKPGLNWTRLELIFRAASTLDPSPRTFFTTLYYLFPCNVLRFMRGPVEYLEKYHLESPFAESWESVLDEGEIKGKCESLLRVHVCHPLIVRRDAIEELSQKEFWSGYGLARIKSEIIMLDIRNAIIGNPESQRTPSHDEDQNAFHSRMVTLGRDTPTSSEYFDTSSDPPEASTEDMIAASVALRRSLGAAAIAQRSAHFPLNSLAIKSGLATVHEISSTFEREPDEVPSNVVQAMSELQREVLMLRNELNFELWLARENVKHIGRLYREQILSKNAEAERQGLYNKLRNYRAQVVSLERQLKEHKEQASSAKHKYADWNTELLQKLRDSREEKKSWISEATALRAAEKDAQTKFKAQGNLLAEATKEIFTLKTQIKENQPKIDRLRDYEAQIAMHLKMQKLWDADFEKFNERGAQMKEMATQYRKMQMRLDSSEESHREADDLAREYKRKARSLEVQLSIANEKAQTSQRSPAAMIAEVAAEKTNLTNSNKKLRQENADLRDEVEELRAMVEVLKEQVSGRKGLVSEARALNGILSR